MTVGIVGLGAGTLATYGRPGDLFRFYEINTQVIDVATNTSLFTFLPSTSATVDLVVGDARRMLERERTSHQNNPKQDPPYDLLVIDAYNGDAVPYHLTTREAFQLYFDRLAPEGMLAVHISNWHIDLLPVCKSIASDLGVYAYGSIGYSDSPVTSGSIWVFMTRLPHSYRYPGRPERIKDVEWGKVRDIRTLTDERGSLMMLLR
jgi:spermidine synthase